MSSRCGRPAACAAIRAIIRGLPPVRMRTGRMRSPGSACSATCAHRRRVASSSSGPSVCTLKELVECLLRIAEGGDARRGAGEQHEARLGRSLLAQRPGLGAIDSRVVEQHLQVLDDEHEAPPGLVGEVEEARQRQRLQAPDRARGRARRAPRASAVARCRRRCAGAPRATGARPPRPPCRPPCRSARRASPPRYLGARSTSAATRCKSVVSPMPRAPTTSTCWIRGRARVLAQRLEHAAKARRRARTKPATSARVSLKAGLWAKGGIVMGGAPRRGSSGSRSARATSRRRGARHERVVARGVAREVAVVLEHAQHLVERVMPAAVIGVERGGRGRAEAAGDRGLGQEVGGEVAVGGGEHEASGSSSGSAWRGRGCRAAARGRRARRRRGRRCRCPGRASRRARG